MTRKSYFATNGCVVTFNGLFSQSEVSHTGSLRKAVLFVISFKSNPLFVTSLFKWQLGVTLSKHVNKIFVFELYKSLVFGFAFFV